jgi:kexin
LTNIPRGESGTGTWTIVVKDTIDNEHTGKFVDWHMKLWGETRDASKAKVLPMPTEEDDDDHAKENAPTATAAKPTNSATDGPNRPVNPKPTGTKTGEAASASPSSSSANKTSTWLPSFLPTFGVSAATQAWIYGSLVLIVVFCAGLGVYFYLARRRRLRNNPRNDYEFELLDDDEAEALAGGGREKGVAGVAGAGGAAGGGARGAGGRRGGRTRGGELYDAFAGESDEDGVGAGDDDDSDDFGGRAGGGLGGQYRDRSGSGSEGSVSPIRMSEKLPGRRDSAEEEAEHHVIGESDDEEEDSDEEEESGDDQARPLHGGTR